MYMDTDIAKRFLPTQTSFFTALKNNIDDDIHFYGSIRRFDYLPGKSDIDVDLFTANEDSSLYKLCTFLNMGKDEFKKVVYKIDNRIVRGYKCKYENSAKHLSVEFSIYNHQYEELVKKQHDKANQLPFVMIWCLYIVKCCYYYLGILSPEVYVKIKHLLLHMSSERNFILLS